jgi:hypothetical protein
MTDEGDIRQEKAFFDRQRGQRVIENLKKRRMNGVYAADRQEALSLALEMIPTGTVVARGDGITLDQIGLPTALQARHQNTVIDPFESGENGYVLPPEERRQMMREAFLADVYVTGTNAITLDGQLVNIDGRGNRAAALIFGPAKVVVIVGVNKIVKDVEAGLGRIHGYAAPLNAQRHYVKHHDTELGELPCIKTGDCVDCRNPWRICNYTVIVDGALPQDAGRINVILVGEELGI